jgi:hypothetical protein
LATPIRHSLEPWKVESLRKTRDLKVRSLNHRHDRREWICSAHL